MVDLGKCPLAVQALKLSPLLAGTVVSLPSCAPPRNLPWWGTLLLTVGLPLVLILILVVIVYLLCRAWRNRLKDVEYEGVSHRERVFGVGL